MSNDVWLRRLGNFDCGWMARCKLEIAKGRTNVQLRAGNVVLPPVEGEALCQPDNGVLGHCVGDVVGARGVGGDGAVVDDSGGQGIGRYMGRSEYERREGRKRQKGR
jgi:hypothetical protein